MGLIKLLSAGRSFVGLASDRTRYQMTSQSVVPNFGKKPAPRASKRSAKAVESARNGLAGLGGFSRPPKTLTVVSSSATASDTKAAKAARPWTKPISSPVAVIVSQEPPPVRAELRLGSVKVARNDLSDADLELVVATPAGKSASVAGAKGFVQKLKMTRMVRACLAWL